MPNIPTHSPEIPLRRKFSCLSARVVWSSSVSGMIAAASCSPQFSICISLAPLRSSAIASSFLGGVPYNQHHYHHSSSSSRKKWQQPSFWKDVSSRVLKIQRLYGTEYPLFAKAREIAAGTGNSNQKKCNKGATCKPKNGDWKHPIHPYNTVRSHNLYYCVLVRKWGPIHRDVCQPGVVRQSLPQVLQRHTIKLLQLKMCCSWSFHLEDFLLELVHHRLIVPGLKPRLTFDETLLPT